MAVNIQPYLDIIQNASSGEDVRDAIVNCMSEINKDSAFDVTNKTIKAKLSNINKTYSAPSKQVWKQVTIEIEDDSGQTINTGNQTKYDFEVDNYTEPRTYNAVEEHGENAVWGDIIVKTDFSGNWDGIVDNVIISTSDLDETSTYSASTQGKTAFRSVTFSDVDPIKDGGGYYGPNGEGYFNITFDTSGGIWSDGTTKAKQKSIQAGDSIDISPKPTKTGYTFMGWKSNYGNSVAKRSETVYATWDTPSIVVDEVETPWATIMITKGADVPIGGYKSLEVNVEIPYSADKSIFPDIEHAIGRTLTGSYTYEAVWLFMKVAAGEAGSTSSFLSMLPVYATDTYMAIPSHIQDYDEHCPISGYNSADYANSVKMQWLNTVFLDYVMPTFKSSISPVVKHYRYRNNDLNITMNKSASHKIWIPSVKEMWITGYDDQEGHPWTGQYLEDTISEMYTKALAEGAEYFNNWLHLSSGEDRKRIFELLSQNYPGNNGSLRDMCYGHGHENVPVPHPMSPDLLNTVVFDGTGVSQIFCINPFIIGFCL